MKSRTRGLVAALILSVLASAAKPASAAESDGSSTNAEAFASHVLDDLNIPSLLANLEVLEDALREQQEQFGPEGHCPILDVLCLVFNIVLAGATESALWGVAAAGAMNQASQCAPQDTPCQQFWFGQAIFYAEQASDALFRTVVGIVGWGGEAATYYTWLFIVCPIYHATNQECPPPPSLPTLPPPPTPVAAYAK